jgi:hypothetical protein
MERGEEFFSGKPGRRGMALMTINNTVKIKTTTTAKMDIGYSLLYISIYVYVVQLQFVPYIKKHWRPQIDAYKSHTTSFCFEYYSPRISNGRLYFVKI